MPSTSLIKILFFLLVISVHSHAQSIPPHGGHWVHDEAGILSSQTIGELEQILKYERDSTSNQIAVLIVPTIETGDIDGYAVKVFEDWKLGQAAKDNGVLFLIALNDRKMRIEVGVGLEGALTDAMSTRINRNEVAPRFRAGDYDGGVKAGVMAIIKTIKGEYVNNDPPQRKRKRGSPLVTIIIVIIILVISRRKGGGGGGMGGYWAAGSLLGGGGFGRGGGGGSFGDFGGGGISGGGGSSDSW
jgi:uncharacterized protein